MIEGGVWGSEEMLRERGWMGEGGKLARRWYLRGQDGERGRDGRTGGGGG